MAHESPKSPYYELAAKAAAAGPSPRDGGPAGWQQPPMDHVLDTVLGRYTLPQIGVPGAQPVAIAFAYNNTMRMTRVEVTNLGNGAVIIGLSAMDVMGPAGNGAPVYQLPGNTGRVFFLAPRQKFFAGGVGSGAQVSVCTSEFPLD